MSYLKFSFTNGFLTSFVSNSPLGITCNNTAASPQIPLINMGSISFEWESVSSSFILEQTQAPIVAALNSTCVNTGSSRSSGHASPLEGPSRLQAPAAAAMDTTLSSVIIPCFVPATIALVQDALSPTTMRGELEGPSLVPAPTVAAFNTPLSSQWLVHDALSPANTRGALEGPPIITTLTSFVPAPFPAISPLILPTRAGDGGKFAASLRQLSWCSHSCPHQPQLSQLGSTVCHQ